MSGGVVLVVLAEGLVGEGGSLVARTGHWVVTYGTSRSNAVTGVT